MAKKPVSFNNYEEFSESDDESLNSLRSSIFLELELERLEKKKIDESTNSSDSSIHTFNYRSPFWGIRSSNKSDYELLLEEKSINDRIMNWALTYIYKRVLSTRDQSRTFIYDSHFFPALTFQSFEPETSSIFKMTTKYDELIKFVGKVNIFEKDFIVIPINEEIHWYLMIICFLKHIRSHQVSDASSSSDSDSSFDPRRPYILVFDSMGDFSKKEEVDIVRDYLHSEYLRNYKQDISFENYALKCIYPKVLKQNNLADGGIFVLLYFKYFFKNPIKAYRSPIMSTENWFSPKAAIKLRKKLADRLKHYLEKKRNRILTTRFITT